MATQDCKQAQIYLNSPIADRIEAEGLARAKPIFDSTLVLLLELARVLQLILWRVHHLLLNSADLGTALNALASQIGSVTQCKM